MNKVDKIIALITKGEITKACSIARKFFFGLTTEEKRSIEITADCKTDKQKHFYKSIGVNVMLHYQLAESILRHKYMHIK